MEPWQEVEGIPTGDTAADRVTLWLNRHERSMSPWWVRDIRTLVRQANALAWAAPAASSLIETE